MYVILKKQWCGHVAGTKVSVSDDRAWHMMVADIAEPDAEFLDRRKRQAEKLIEKAETTDSKRARGREKR